MPSPLFAIPLNMGTGTWVITIIAGLGFVVMFGLSSAGGDYQGLINTTLENDAIAREFTKAEYDQAIEDRAQYKLDKQDNGYARDRQESYPALPEQLDLLFHDMTAGKGDKTGEWYKALKKVKDDNPKPS